jgi:hypothetical protein
MAMADTGLPHLKVAKHHADRPEPPHAVRARPAAQRRIQAWCSRRMFETAYSMNSLNSLNQQKDKRRCCEKTLSRIDTPLITLPIRLNQAGKIVSGNR